MERISAPDSNDQPPPTLTLLISSKFVAPAGAVKDNSLGKLQSEGVQISLTSPTSNAVMLLEA